MEAETPGPNDFISYWDKGRRPRGNRKSQIELYKQVSTLETLELAREYAVAYGLGSHVAEIEVPDDVVRKPNRRGHVGLVGTTREQLIGYIQQILPVEAKVRP
jgi:hypothetical protein